MDSFVQALSLAWEHISTPTTLPTAVQLGAALVLGALLVVWRRSWRRISRVVTVAHEGGHAFAAVITRRSVHGVTIHADGSGLTNHFGKSGGLGSAVVAFAGYPAPGVVGALLILGSISGHPRMFAAIIAVALLRFLWTTRNLYGWLVVGLCLVAAAAASWYPTGQFAAIFMAATGSFLLIGSVRDLFQERRLRRSGSARSDVSALAGLGPLPGGFWWTAMLVIVLASAAFAWNQVTRAYFLV